ncbi:MAG: DUF2339 domain-containing protein [Candidatus Hydrogenedentota bacterium]
MLLIFGGVALFILVGSIKGFIAHREVTQLRREQIVLRRKVTSLENAVAFDKEPKRDTAKSGDAPVPSVVEDSSPKEKEISLPQPPAPYVAPIKVEEQETASPGIEKPSAPTKTFEYEEGMFETPQNESEQPAPSIPIKEKSQWAAKFEGMNWETIIGTYIVPRAGALALVIAVFIVLALAAQKYGPAFRIVLGYGVGAALLAGGRFTEQKYPPYARVLYGAGLATAYFVTFATHFIPFARIFDSPLPSLAGMAVIVGIWALIAEKKQSPTIAMLVTALGHFTIALTSLSVANPGIYSVFGILMLSLGSAFFLLKNRWYYVAAVGMIASYGNHFLMLLNSQGTDTKLEFTIGISVLTAYLLIFALSELFAPEQLRRKSVPSTIRSLFVTINTALFFILGSILVQSYEFTQDYHYVFQYCLGATLLGIAVLYYLRRAQDPMYNTYIAKAVTMATLGLAMQFDGHTLTVGLSIEMIALLVSSRQSGLVVTRALAHVVAAIVFVHGMATFLLVMRYMRYDDEAYVTTLIQTVIPSVAFLIAALAYQRIYWSSRMRVGVSVPRSLRTFLWQLDLYDQPDDRSKEPKKPLDGLLMPCLYASAGGVLWLSYTLRLIDIGHRFNLYGLIAVGLLLLAWLVRSKPFALVSTFFSTATFIMTWHAMVNNQFSAWYIVGVIATALVALSTERKLLPERNALGLHRVPLAPYFFYAIALWSIGLYLTHWFDTMHFFIALLVASSIAAGLSMKLHTRALSLGAAVYLLWAHLAWQLEMTSLFDTHTLSTIDTITAFAMIAVSIGGDRFFAMRSKRNFGSFFLCIAFLTSLRLMDLHILAPWIGTVTVALAGAFLGYAAIVRSRTAGILAFLATLLAVISQLRWSYETHELFQLAPTLTGFIGVIALFIVFERAIALRAPERFSNQLPMLTGFCVLCASVLGVIMLERIPNLAALYLTLSWSLLSVGYFALAISTQQKMYRYAGLGILSLCALRVVVVDTTALDAVARVFAYGGLGVVLLAIGLGYAKAFGNTNTTREVEGEDVTDE